MEEVWYRDAALTAPLAFDYGSAHQSVSGSVISL